MKRKKINNTVLEFDEKKAKSELSCATCEHEEKMPLYICCVCFNQDKHKAIAKLSNNASVIKCYCNDCDKELLGSGKEELHLCMECSENR